MAKEMSSENILAFPRASKESVTESKKWPKQRFWLYMLGLLIYDAIALYGSFWLTKPSTGVPVSDQHTWSMYLWSALCVFLVMPFISSQSLYSYHLIFSLKRHSAALGRAAAWGALTILFVAGQFALPLLMENHLEMTIAAVIVGIAGMIGFVYKFKNSLHNLYRSFGIGLIAVAVIRVLDPGQAAFSPYSTWNMLIGLLLGFALLAAGRYFIIETIYNGWLLRYFRRQVGIIGTNEEAEKIASHIIDNNAPFWIAGTIGCTNPLNTPIAKRCLGDIVEIPAISKVNRLSDIIVTDEHMDKRTLMSLLDFALLKGITVWFPPSVLPIIDEKIYIDHFCGIPMIRMCQQKQVVFYNRFKYAFDALVTLPMLVALLPLLVIIAIAIKINSKGPVLYLANAIGRDGQPFKMFKFRSMRVNNDSHIHQQYVTKLIKGEIKKKTDDDKPLKITNDPRVTAVGRLLRKSSLDELPQLINVILGQMSLIGPRPCLPYEYDVYQDWYKKRASIRPGITGLWQVTGRSEVDFEDMILLDLYYVYNRNIWMDLNILSETLSVVLKKKGAY